MPFYRASYIVYASTQGAVEADSEEEALQKFLEEAPGLPNICHCCSKNLDLGDVGELVNDSIQEITEDEYEDIRFEVY